MQRRPAYCRSLLAGFCCVVLLSGLGRAAEITYPKDTYSADGLAEVRRWEQAWAGKKISRHTVDGVKDFLPESLYHLIKDTETWGESWFTVGPYQTIRPTPGEIALTKKYYGTAKIGPGGELLGWTAGIPFPDGAGGTAIAHNFKRRNCGDGTENSNTGYIIDGKLNYEMLSASVNRYCYWAGRYDTPPVPAFSDNPKQIWRTGLVTYTDPPEYRNIKTLEIQYKDEMRPYDSWSWLPAARRVQRLTTANREDPTGGADYCEYDIMGYDGPVQINTYRVLGQKEFLWARHTDTSKLVHAPGTCLWSGYPRERLKTYVLEVKNKSSSFIYAQQVWYIDPETWQILYAERYDREGRLWRILDQFYVVGKGCNGVPIGQYTAIQSFDLRSSHATILSSDMKSGLAFDRDIFTKEYLQKKGY